MSTVLRMTTIYKNKGGYDKGENVNRNYSKRNLQMGIEMIQSNSMEIEITNGIKKWAS